jgi:hypothetical protein
MFRNAGISLSEWDFLAKKYVTDPDNGIVQTPDARTTARGNLVGQLLSRNMTWLSAYKAIIFLRAVRFRLTLEVETESGKYLKSSVTQELKPQIDRGNRPDPFAQNDTDDGAV